jgi:alginate O-acetyltransferase complex protein AlgI
MLFNSFEFAIFFPTVCLLYFNLPYRLRTPLLLVASCGFYMAFIPSYILILFVTILIDYYAGLYLIRVPQQHKKLLLWISIIATCLVLFIFKYFYFFTHSFIGLAGLFGWTLQDPALRIILPIGLSFHTFQSLSYVIEVYRGNQQPERDFITYATYVMFFPQLVAGPIERPQNLLSQFREAHNFEYSSTVSGLKQMAWGFFKKLVIADRLALYVNDVYHDPTQYNGLQLTIATIFFAYQIYCDFSGYSDIALGSARILGFRMMTNFNDPYSSQSISEFWRRWHISLSTWFRDYLYIPMGGNRVNLPRRQFNILLTFAVSGLWHGANWTYVAWGTLNGLYLILGTYTQEYRDKLFDAFGIRNTSSLRTITKIATTFGLTCLAWIIFRANTLQDAWYILSHFYKNWDISAISTPQFLLRQLPVALIAVATLECVQWFRRHPEVTSNFPPLPMPARWLAYIAAILLILLFGVFRSNQFIYFQF